MKKYCKIFLLFQLAVIFSSRLTYAQTTEKAKYFNNQSSLVTLISILLILVLLAFYIVYNKYKGLKNENSEFKGEVEQTREDTKKAIQQIACLEDENRMKDRLLSIISHDLRHPLVNTKSILDLINLKLVTEQEQGELFEQLEAQYIRSISLLDNLLFWIRGNMKGIVMEKTNINMQQLVNVLIEEQRIPLMNKDIKISNDVLPDITWFAEKEMIKIVFRNLISNAIKFTPADGLITVSSMVNDEFAFIAVRDSGVGMTKDTLEKVSARQYFTSRGTSNERGSGFGLMLVKELISRHKGELYVESEPGRGSTFSVKFPCQAVLYA